MAAAPPLASAMPSAPCAPRAAAASSAGAAQRRRAQRQRADARHVGWLTSLLQASSSHHSGAQVAAPLQILASRLLALETDVAALQGAAMHADAEVTPDVRACAHADPGPAQGAPVGLVASRIAVFDQHKHSAADATLGHAGAQPGAAPAHAAVVSAADDHVPADGGGALARGAEPWLHGIPDHDLLSAAAADGESHDDLEPWLHAWEGGADDRPDPVPEGPVSGSWVLAALCHAADHAHESASHALDAAAPPMDISPEVDLSQASAEAPGMDLEPWLHDTWEVRADPGEAGLEDLVSGAALCQAAESSEDDAVPPALVQGSPDALRQRQSLAFPALSAFQERLRSSAAEARPRAQEHLL